MSHCVSSRCCACATISRIKYVLYWQAEHQSPACTHFNSIFPLRLSDAAYGGLSTSVRKLKKPSYSSQHSEVSGRTRAVHAPHWISISSVYTQIDDIELSPIRYVFEVWMFFLCVWMCLPPCPHSFKFVYFTLSGVGLACKYNGQRMSNMRYGGSI